MNGNGNKNKSAKARQNKNRANSSNGIQAAVAGVRVKNPPRGNGGARQGAVAAAYATGQYSGPPKVFRDQVGQCRIVHRELIGSVTGTVAFTVASSFALNPGLQTSFPWLSIEAQGWERYRFNKLNFCYYTRTGSNVPGSVMLAPDYDPADAAPASEQIASDYQDCAEDAPWKDIKCILRPEALRGGAANKYVRTSALGANQDIKTYDAGNLHLCTVDGTAVSWGKLWVEYDVTFFTPQIPPGGIQLSGAMVSGGGSLAAATPFGSVPIQTGSLGLAAAATNVISLSNVPIGSELVLFCEATGTVISATSFGTLVGVTAKNTLFSGFPAAATTVCQAASYVVTAGTVNVTWSLTATTITGAFCVATILAPAPSV